MKSKTKFKLFKQSYIKENDEIKDYEEIYLSNYKNDKSYI